MTKQEVLKVAKAYRKGVLVKKIASDLGYTLEHIYATLRQLRAEGVSLPRRTPGGSHHKAQKRGFQDALSELTKQS